MKRTDSIAVWSIILIPSVILAMYIGQSVSSDVAALATGAIIGLMGAALAALITFLVRDERHTRQREEARRPHPTPHTPPPTYIEGEWREWHPTTPAPTRLSSEPASLRPQAPGPRPQLEAPTRAITIRRS